MERIKNLSKTQKVLMAVIAVMIVAFSIIYPVIMSIKGIEEKVRSYLEVLI